MQNNDAYILNFYFQNPKKFKLGGFHQAHFFIVIYNNYGNYARPTSFEKLPLVATPQMLNISMTFWFSCGFISPIIPKITEFTSRIDDGLFHVTLKHIPQRCQITQVGCQLTTPFLKITPPFVFQLLRVLLITIIIQFKAK